jgi:hypothetical protein
MKQSRLFYTPTFLSTEDPYLDVQKIKKNPPTAFFCSGDVVYYFLSKSQSSYIRPIPF